MTTNNANIITHVITTAMHILHESYLYGSELWPVNGFRAGSGIGSDLEDCVYVGVNAPSNQAGRIFFNIYNTPEPRMIKQAFHIKQIFDFSRAGGLYFEDELRGKPDEPLWFLFKYNPEKL